MKDRKAVWLEVGLQLLVDEGPKGLTVERLCQSTGKTKGSFYHHFAGVREFEQRLLEYWEQAHTRDLIDLTSQGPPQTALRELRRLALRLPFEREAAFRAWGARNPEAARVVARVDALRVAHLGRFHIDNGQPPDLAEAMAWLEYSLFLGMAQLGDSLPKEQSRLARSLFERRVINHD